MCCFEDAPGQTIIADKGYDAQERLVQPLQEKGKAVVIPSRSNRKRYRAYDKYLYKATHSVENFFARLKQYHAIATRYDKTAINFLGAYPSGSFRRLAYLMTRPSNKSNNAYNKFILRE